MKDEYGYKKVFKSYSVSQLIKVFNGEVGQTSWVRARGFFLEALRDSFLATQLDCSSFIDEEGMSLCRKIRRDGKRLVQASAFLVPRD